MLRDVEPHDWDICTSARPEETEHCFAGHRLIKTRLKHGTVTVLEDGEPYSNSRWLDYVEFVSSLKADLARRDLTMNAITLGMDGSLWDPFDGGDDIKAGGILRQYPDVFCQFWSELESLVTLEQNTPWRTAGVAGSTPFMRWKRLRLTWF